MGPAQIAETSSDQDEALMLAYGRGDAASFERLYSRHRGPTYRYLLRHVGDRALADELHQDLWLRVVHARERYRPEARFTTWLYTLARHRLVDHYRSRRDGREATLDADPSGDEPAAEATESGDRDDPVTQAIDAQAGRRLIRALAEIPAPQRDAFLLHVEAGLSLGEIAALSDVSAETVKSRLRYAYRRLRAALEDLA